MSNFKKTTKSTILIIIFSLGSKFLGFIRETLIGAKFGAGKETDAFFMALTVISVITALLEEAVGTTFIPIISEVESNEGNESKINHTNNMINIMIFLSLILAIVTFILMPFIIRIFAGGFIGEQRMLTINLTRIGSIMILFTGIKGILKGYLQSEQRFMATAVVGLPFNLTYIIYLFSVAYIFGIQGLMLAGVLASFIQLIIYGLEAKHTGFKYRFVLDIKDIYIKRILSLSLPILMGVAINDFNAIVDKSLASSLVAGSISALNYASKLNGLILGVFISAITTVIFPILSKTANSNDIEGVKRTMSYGINIILLLTIPATVGLLVLARPIVEIAFQRGEFGVTATIMTSQALTFYSIGLVAMSLQLFLSRVYYSLQDTKTPMINGAIAVGINIVLNLILVRYMAHSGLALATSISISIAVLMLLYGLKKKIGSIGAKGYIITFLKASFASIIMGLVAYFTYNGVYGSLGSSKLYNLVSLLVAAGLSAMVYGILLYVFRVEEVRDVVNKVISR